MDGEEQMKKYIVCQTIITRCSILARAREEANAIEAGIV
jgi:hypothetical protein